MKLNYPEVVQENYGRFTAVAGSVSADLFQSIHDMVIKALSDPNGLFHWIKAKENLLDGEWINQFADFVLEALGITGWKADLLRQALTIIIPMIISALLSTQNAFTAPLPAPKTVQTIAEEWATQTAG